MSFTLSVYHSISKHMQWYLLIKSIDQQHAAQLLATVLLQLHQLCKNVLITVCFPVSTKSYHVYIGIRMHVSCIKTSGIFSLLMPSHSNISSILIKGGSRSCCWGHPLLPLPSPPLSPLLPFLSIPLSSLPFPAPSPPLEVGPLKSN